MYMSGLIIGRMHCGKKGKEMQHPTEEEKELHEALLLNIAESEQETKPTDGIWFMNVVEKLD